jgi:hypothetical protein
VQYADFKTFPWNIKRAFNQLQKHGQSYITDSIFYVYLGKLAKNKALSFHLNEVKCFNKNKSNKKLEFGRNIQLGRITGNFLVVGKSTNVRMEDKRSVKPMLELHQELFGEGKLKSFGSDKGYYSHNNKALLVAANIEEIGLQQPRLKDSLPENIRKETRIKLTNRRAGIEPLIGHAKHGGQLGRSRMKSDETTLSSAYSAVLGFNLRQLIRYEMGKVQSQAA